MALQEFRIKADTNANEKVVHVNLKQDVDILKILSLEINSEDTYQLHTSGYGVIVGRVLGNGAYGIPNVKVSVFIPLDNTDKEDSIISNEYPYATLQTKDKEGKKYNLLSNSTYSGFDGNHKPIGSFPNKRQILDNDGEVEIFDKYWKYTTITNEVGDYMLFGVPTGVTQVHIDCDISDIGLLSQRPYDLVAKGYDENLFDSMMEFKTNSMENAPQIMTQNKTITVFPFWGDKDENKIGITRCDIDLNYEFMPSCVFMGSTITDSVDGYIDVNGVACGTSGKFNSLRTYTGNIEVLRQTENGSVETLKENVKGIIDGNGVWCYQIPMNLDRIGMDEEGNLIQVNTPGKGIATRTRVRFRISINSDDGDVTTCKILVPNNPKLNHNYTFPCNIQTEDEWEKWYEFGKDTPDCCFRDLYWNKVYSVKQYYPRIQYGPIDPVPTGPYYYGDIYNPKSTVGDKYKLVDPDYRQFPINYASPFNCINCINPSNLVNAFPYNTMYAGAEHRPEDGEGGDTTNKWFQHQMTVESKTSFIEKGLLFCFENDWVNGCLYFPNVQMKGDKHFNEDDHSRNFFITGRHNFLYDTTNNKYTTLGYFDKWRIVSDSDLLSKISSNDVAKVVTDVNVTVTNEERERLTWANSILATQTRNIFDLSLALNIIDNGVKKGIYSLTESSHVFYDGIQFNQDYTNNISIEKVSRFSQIQLNYGLIKKVYNSLGQAIFYYSCGGGLGNTYQRLYATDIINLGNLIDVLDVQPHLFETLPHTSATFPPIAPSYEMEESGMNMNGTRKIVETMWANTDRDNVDLFGNIGDVNTFDNCDFNGYGMSKKSDEWIEGNSFIGSCIESYKQEKSESNVITVNKNNYKEIIQYAQERYTLFFGQRGREQPNSLHYLPTTFTNTARICELGVVNDHQFAANNHGYNGKNVYEYPINGMIDRFDIDNSLIRSEFASLNYDINKYVINPNTKQRCFMPTPMYMVDFDGRLSNYVRFRHFQDIDEKEDKSYIKFRYGDIGNGPIFYDKTMFTTNEFNEYDNSEKIFANMINSNLILTENSFYFYFGLRSGNSALDKLRGKYYAKFKEGENIREQGRTSTNPLIDIQNRILLTSPAKLTMDITISCQDGIFAPFENDNHILQNTGHTYEIRRVENDELISGGTMVYDDACQCCSANLAWDLIPDATLGQSLSWYNKMLTLTVYYEDKKGRSQKYLYPFKVYFPNAIE